MADETATRSPWADQDDALEAVIEEWKATREEEPETFLGALFGFYWNLIDDLHDSVGDAEYQQGHVETLLALKQLLVANPREVEELESAREEIGDMIAHAIATEDLTEGVIVPEGLMTDA
jgi:hypothetical protein